MRPIARIWRGTVLTSRADEYADYLRETGIADILDTPGNGRGCCSSAARTVCTLPDGLDAGSPRMAIEAFRGSRDRTARLETRDEEFLVSSEPEAEHNGSR